MTELKARNVSEKKNSIQRFKTLLKIEPTDCFTDRVVQSRMDLDVFKSRVSSKKVKLLYVIGLGTAVIDRLCKERSMEVWMDLRRR